MPSQRFGRCVAFAAMVLGGLLAGAPGAGAQTQAAVEYYYAAGNHYFVTSFPDEIAALDGGAFGGAWQRTVETFGVWTGPAGGALPTCRFFSATFAPKSSHFCTPVAIPKSGFIQADAAGGVDGRAFVPWIAADGALVGRWIFALRS